MKQLYAQNTNNPVATSTVVPRQIKDPFGGKNLNQIVTQGINILLALIVIAAVIVIVISGFRMITGGNNPMQIAAAKKAIMYSVMGLIVAFMSFAIVQIIQAIIK